MTGAWRPLINPPEDGDGGRSKAGEKDARREGNDEDGTEKSNEQTGWSELTEYTPLIVRRSRLPHSPTDGLGVFTSTVTYFTIKIIIIKIHTLVGWCKFSKVVGYFGIRTRGMRSSLM